MGLRARYFCYKTSATKQSSKLQKQKQRQKQKPQLQNLIWRYKDSCVLGVCLACGGEGGEGATVSRLGESLQHSRWISTQSPSALTTAHVPPHARHPVQSGGASISTAARLLCASTAQAREAASPSSRFRKRPLGWRETAPT